MFLIVVINENNTIPPVKKKLNPGIIKNTSKEITKYSNIEL